MNRSHPYLWLSLLWSIVFPVTPVFAQRDLLDADAHFAEPFPLVDFAEPLPSGNTAPLPSEREAASMSQIPSASDLSDILPTDWSYEALRSLIDRYGCIQGYPDQTFRGDRPLTRFEFAAALHTCLDSVTNLIAAAQESTIQKADLETLMRLSEDFSSELEGLRGTVDSLEARTATLDGQQFSTTTQLSGSTVFAVAIPLMQDDRFDEQTTFGYRTRLNFNTSFVGRDLLRARFESGNISPYEAGQIPLSFGSNTRGSVPLQKLFYSFPVGDFANVEVGATGYALVDVITSPISPTAFGLGETGNLYKALQAPQYGVLPISGAGVSTNLRLTTQLSLDLAYIAGDPTNPAPGNGLFNGSYVSLAQLNWLDDRFQAALTFQHGYVDSSTPLTVGGIYQSAQAPAIANITSAEVNYFFTPTFQVGGGSYYASVTGMGSRPDYGIWSWHVNAILSDVGNRGSQLALVAGVPPYTRDLGDLGETKDTGFATEIYYLHRLNDNILITPSVIWLQNPFNDNGESSTVLGVFRTTFLF